MFVHALKNDITPNITSSIVRFVVMGTLGGLAVLRGLRWARRLFAAMLYFAGAVFLLASFAPLPIIGVQTGHFHFLPGILAFAMANLLVGHAATLGGRATETRLQQMRSAGEQEAAPDEGRAEGAP